VTAQGPGDAVSVVIPTYNSAALVVQAIDSALGQTAVPAEVLVVDDGSSDDTAARVAAYGNRVRYLHQPNRGVASARNLGVREARGKLIAFLDADDVWHPRKLEIQAAALARHPALGLLGTATYDWPAPAHPDLGPAPPDVPAVVPWESLVIKNYFTTSSILARREVLDRVGPFDSGLQGPEDHDLWIRAAEVAPVANLALPLTGYRSVQGSLSQQAATMEMGMRRILAKLDERDAWRGRGLLRRKAFSYFYYSTAYMHHAAGSGGIAMRNLLKSFAWYPLPYRRSEVRQPLARPKRLAVFLARSFSRPPAGPPNDAAGPGRRPRPDGGRS